MNMSKKRKPPKWASNDRWRVECNLDYRLRNRLWMFGLRWKRQFEQFTQREGVHPDEFWALIMSYVDERPLPGRRPRGGVKPIRPRFVSGERNERGHRLWMLRQSRTAARRQRNDSIRTTFDRLRGRGMSKGAAYEKLAVRHGLSARQIRSIVLGTRPGGVAPR